ncbi:hypothetical protein FB645_002918 [Coemansia sp. IMI 203386]|nr:hypothetical protein FB645_002918 [Coemansia sp. IMI 203386]
MIKLIFYIIFYFLFISAFAIQYEYEKRAPDAPVVTQVQFVETPKSTRYHTAEAQTVVAGTKNQEKALEKEVDTVTETKTETTIATTTATVTVEHTPDPRPAAEPAMPVASSVSVSTQTIVTTEYSSVVHTQVIVSVSPTTVTEISTAWTRVPMASITIWQNGTISAIDVIPKSEFDAIWN